VTYHAAFFDNDPGIELNTLPLPAEQAFATPGRI
jgi:hypothetical protein